MFDFGLVWFWLFLSLFVFILLLAYHVVILLRALSVILANLASVFFLRGLSISQFLLVRGLGNT